MADRVPDPGNSLSAELPLFLHWEKSVCWLLAKTGKFPKNVRFTFTVRIENLAIEILESIIAARYARRRLEHLERISSGLDTLRVLLRLCHRMGHLDHRGYERAMVLIDEAGRMTGGWRRHEIDRARGGGRPVRAGAMQQRLATPQVEGGA